MVLGVMLLCLADSWMARDVHKHPDAGGLMTACMPMMDDLGVPSLGTQAKKLVYVLMQSAAGVRHPCQAHTCESASSATDCNIILINPLSL